MELTVRSPDFARAQMVRVYEAVTESVKAGHPVVVIVREETRSPSQNKMLHAMLGEIAATVEWCGQKRSITTWKRLMVAAWLRAEGNNPEVLTAIDGAGIEVIYEPTSSMSKRQLNSLIEFVGAWMAEHVPAPEPRWEVVE